MVRRVTHDVRLGGYEPVCRPIVDAIVDALDELYPYLHMSPETAHPFVKPEGERLLIGYLTRLLGIIGRIRASLHLFPGTTFRDRRESIVAYLNRREAIVREDIGIMRENFRRTQNPRTVVTGAQFVIMKVRTREFQELQQTYLLLLSAVIGEDAYRFFREQYRMVEWEMEKMRLLCQADGAVPRH
jgi:hypothetical protein